LQRFVPETYGKYFEPFLGGGALFFALSPTRALLGDVNSDLVNCYQQVRDNVGAVGRYLGRLCNSKHAYYVVRSSSPRSAAARAARTIYLAALSFNGIYRVNRQGQFNVPYGGRAKRRLPDSSVLRTASSSLQGVQVRCADFELSLSSAKSGDLVYLDPPYTVTHGTNGFLKYNALIFSWRDQERLASLVRRLVVRGCGVIMTNASHISIRRLYRGMSQHRISRISRMAADAAHRRPVEELIITNLVLR
jgi:DNA adenine methylase